MTTRVSSRHWNACYASKRLVPRSRGSLQQRHRGGQMELETGLVLLVEDDDDLREVEVGILRRAGLRVAEARQGIEALELVEEEMPQVIFLDMRMPDMDGWAFAREF